MNWAKELIDLYDSNIESVGKIFNDKDGKNKYTLFPLYHSSALADIEITITENGKFLGASLIEKEDRFTIIPVTEESNSRTNGMCPHPLCDNLQFCLKDSNYVRNAKPDIGKYHASYMAQLGDWLDSLNSHQTVRAIYRYLDSGSLLTDLLHAGIITLEEDGYLPDGTEKRFIRFLTCADGESKPVPCWLDKSLQEAFIRYYESMQKAEGAGLPDGGNAAGVQPASEKDTERRGQCKAVLCCGQTILYIPGPVLHSGRSLSDRGKVFPEATQCPQLDHPEAGESL